MKTEVVTLGMTLEGAKDEPTPGTARKVLGFLGWTIEGVVDTGLFDVRVPAAFRNLLEDEKCVSVQIETGKWIFHIEGEMT